MKQSLMSKNDLRKKSEIRVQKGLYKRVWDEIYFDDYPKIKGTIYNIMKLYDPDDDSVRLSFGYYTGDGCHVEYLEKQEDICEVNELLEMGKKVYEEKVSKIKFSPQPAWID